MTCFPSVAARVKNVALTNGLWCVFHLCCVVLHLNSFNKWYVMCLLSVAARAPWSWLRTVGSCGNQMKKRETQRWFQSDKHQRYWWLLQLYCMKVRMATLGLYGQGSSQSDRRWTGALPLMKFGKVRLRACVALKWMIGNCWGNCPAIRVCSFLYFPTFSTRLFPLCLYCCRHYRLNVNICQRQSLAEVWFQIMTTSNL